MRISEGVEWALHSCVLLGLLPPDVSLPAARLAEFHDIPPAYLAKHLQALSAARIVASVPGPKGGYRLAKPAEQISVLDVVLAVDGPEPAFRCTEIRRAGPAACPPSAYRHPCTITAVMGRAEQAWRAELRAQTVADLIHGLGQNVDVRAARKAAAWFQEVIR